MTNNNNHPITPPPPHLLKKFSAQAQDEAKKRNGAGYLKTFARLCIEWTMNSKTTPNDRQIRSSEIEPSSVLVEQWHMEATGGFRTSDIYIQDIANEAARWGADQELEACIKLLADLGGDGEMIRRYRRPRTLSLKEQALKELKDWTDEKHGPGGEVFLCEGLSVALIREALESLPS